jgi:hypothetical protein
VVEGRGNPLIMDLETRPPYNVIFRNDSLRFNEALVLSEQDRQTIGKLYREYYVAGKAWDFEFSIGNDGVFYFLQARLLPDVETKPDFTIAEIKAQIDPADIIFEAEIVRGRTTRKGIICDVHANVTAPRHIAERVNRSQGVGFAASYGMVRLLEAVVHNAKAFDAGHSGYAVVLDEFPDTMTDVHSATPGKSAVITVDFAGRESHIMTIMRQNPRLKLVYLGVANRIDLIDTLRECGKVKIIVDGRRGLVLKVKEDDLSGAGIGTLKWLPAAIDRQDEKTEKGEIDFWVVPASEVPMSPDEVFENLCNFLIERGISPGFDQFSRGRWGFYPEVGDWSIDVIESQGRYSFLVQYENTAGRSTYDLLMRYFGIID